MKDPYPILNFIKIYERSFIENWNLPALTDYSSQSTISYGGLAQKIAMIHLFFENVGIRPGDKVALCGRDSVEWVKIYMAVVTYGAVIVPILSDFNPVDVSHIVNHSGARLLFVSPQVWEHMQPEQLLKAEGVFAIDALGC